MSVKPCRMCGTPVEYDSAIPAEFVAAALCAEHSWVHQPRVFVVTPS